MHSTDAIRGMLLPIPTVFDGTGEVDEPLMREMTRFYLDAGTHAPPAQLDPTASSIDVAASRQQLGKGGNDHNISEIR